MKRSSAVAWALIFGLHAATSALAQDGVTRTEVSRSDLAAAPDTEVIITRVVQAPGTHVVSHVHSGEEFLYVIAGAPYKKDDGTAGEFVTGSVVHYARGEPHGGRTTLGDTPIELVTIHLVDKGKPLFVPID